jgi:outer membrane protein
MHRLGQISMMVTLYLAFSFSARGQEAWTLEKCISQGIANSLQYEASELNGQVSEVNLKMAEQSRYPNLNGSISTGWNFGRTIDPTNNEFITESFFNNGFGLNSGVNVWNYNKINNSIKQAKKSALAARKDQQQIQSDIALNVSSLFLSILYAKENLKNVTRQLTLTQAQIDVLRKQISVGNRPENDVLELDAQIASNELSIIEAKNTVDINLLNLKQLLRLDVADPFDIQTPTALELTTDPDLLSFQELYNSAIQQQAGVQAAELKSESARLAEQISKADLYPSISLGGSARSNFSNKGQSVDGFEEKIRDQKVIFNGTPSTIGFVSNVPILSNTPYFSQLTDNLSYGVAMQVSIPIYNNYQSKGNIQKARFNAMNANLNVEEVKNKLKITIGQALADAKAAKAKYQATQKSYTAQTNLYNNTLKRFEIGNINTFELARVKTQMEAAEVNSVNAKYEYIFRVKVLEFYLGKTIKF